MCPSSFAFSCSLDPLARRLLVPLGDFLLSLRFPWQLFAVAVNQRKLVATLTDVDLRANSSSIPCFIENHGTLVLVGNILI